MENQKQSLNILRLSKGFLLLVALWLVKQQNVCSSEALEISPRYARESGVSNEFQPSTVGRSDTELALKREEKDSQYGMRRVSRKQVILFFVLILILLKVISVGIERSKQAREKLKQEKAAGDEEFLADGELFVKEGEPQETLPPKTPAQKEDVEKQTPTSGVGGFPQVQPQVPQVQPEVPHVQPEVSHVQPEVPQVQPTVPQVQPEVPQVQPTVPQVKPEVPQVKPKVPQVQPEMPPLQPKVPQVQPQVPRVKRKAPQPPVPQVQPTASMAKGKERGPAQKLPPPLAAQTVVQPQFPEPSTVGPPPAVHGTGHLTHPSYPGVVREQREGIPGHGAVMVPEQDAEVEGLRAECSAISRLLYVVRHLVNKRLQEEAKGYADALTTNVDTAKKAYKDYSAAKGRGDPNTTQIRIRTVNVMTRSLERARNSLLHLASLAKPHGEAMEAYCSQRLHFTDTRVLRSHLSTSTEANSVNLALATLQSVENTSLTLQQENKKQADLLKSAEVIDPSDLRGFSKIYGAVAALNFNMNALERLAALDRALNADILEMHRFWLASKLQADRIPLEVDANLVIGIDTLLSETRPSNGWLPASGISKKEIDDLKALFASQAQDVYAMKSAHDVEAVTAAFERANSHNQKLQYLLPMLKERLRAVLVNQPLSKEEAAIASKKVEGIAEAGIEQSEELFKFCQTVYANVGGKPEEVGFGVGVGKALPNILGSKTKSSIDAQVADVTCREGDVACSVRKYFPTPARQLEDLAREYVVRSHGIVESMKQAKRYRLDKEPFGSSALDENTDFRVEMATDKRRAALLGLRVQYFSRLAAEIEEYEKVFKEASSLPFRRAPDEWNRLQDQFNMAKESISNDTSHVNIPSDVDKMLQLSLRMQNLVLGDRLQLFNAPVDYPPTGSLFR